MNFNFSKIKKLGLALIGIVAVGGILSACGNQSAKSELVKPHQLRIGMTGDFPPYSYRSHGKMDGYEYSVAKDIAKKINLKPKFVFTKWDGLLAGLGAKRYDVVLNDISSVNGTQRSKSFLSSRPYMYSRSIMITRTNEHSLKNLKDIKGKKFAEGTGTGNARIAKKFGASVVPSNESKDTYALIRQGRVNGTVSSVESWKGFAKANSTKGLKVHVVPNSEYPADKIAVLLSKHSPKLKNKINQAIKELKKDGTLKRLSYKYFGHNSTNFNGLD